MKKLIGLILICSVIVSGCSSNSNLDDVVVLLDYVPNTNHTGMYVALDNGYYEENGLNVEIIQPSQGSTESLVASGEVDYGISYSENVAQYNNSNNKNKVTSIYTIFDTNTSGFAAYDSKDINNIKDFKGKTYCGWGSDVENALLNVFLKQGGLSISDIDIVTSTIDFQNSPEECDFMWVYEGWDLVALDEENVKYDYFPFSEYNIDWYTPVIITNEDNLKKEQTQKFIDATRDGYIDSIDDYSNAADIFSSNNPTYDPQFIKDSQKFVSKYYSETGYQDDDKWNDFINILKENNIVSKDLETESLYTNDFN